MSSLDVQVGGSHYKSMGMQPMEFSMKAGLNACQHTIVKYVTRYKQKGGLQDLEKAKHCIDMLRDLGSQTANISFANVSQFVNANKLSECQTAVVAIVCRYTSPDDLDVAKCEIDALIALEYPEHNHTTVLGE